MLRTTGSLPLSEPSGVAHVTGAAQPRSHHTDWAVQEKVSVSRSIFAAELYRGLPSSSLGHLKLVPRVIQSGSGEKMDPIQNPIQLTLVANYI